MPHSKQRYDIAVVYSGKTRRSSMMLHCARWLPGRGEHSQTACGKTLSDYSLVDFYVNAGWHVQSTNQHLWCETCRSAAIAALPPYSNTGAKLNKGGQ